jgi:hypothetical protein
MISSVLDVPKPSSSANSPVAKDDWKWDDDIDESEDDVVFDQVSSIIDSNHIFRSPFNKLLKARSKVQWSFKFGPKSAVI